MIATEAMTTTTKGTEPTIGTEMTPTVAMTTITRGMEPTIDMVAMMDHMTTTTRGTELMIDTEAMMDHMTTTTKGMAAMIDMEMTIAMVHTETAFVHTRYGPISLERASSSQTITSAQIPNTTVD